MKRLMGFTLIEILVALSIFAIIASLTAPVLYRTFHTKDRMTEQINRLNELQLARSLIMSDTQQIMHRSILINEIQSIPAFIGQSNSVEFTRASLQRIAYLCNNDQLIRRHWLTLDGPHRNQFQDKVLLTNLIQCEFNYLEQQNWHSNSNQGHDELPQVIELNLTTKDWGNARLRFIIPEAMYASKR